VLDSITHADERLASLENVVLDLEHCLADARAKQSALLQKLGEIREQDILLEAKALNANRRPPQPKGPQIEEHLRSADRAVQVLEKRLQLATTERSECVRDHMGELLSLLEAEHTKRTREVSRGAQATLRALVASFEVEDQARALHRTYPPPAEENTQPAAPLTTMTGPISTAQLRNGAGQPRRGDLESVLRYLEGFGQETIIGDESAA